MPAMNNVEPWQLVLVMLAASMSKEQQALIEYLQTENRILREKLQKQSAWKRIVMTLAEKRRLAMAAVKVGKDLLRQAGALFSPETLLRWHRALIARKYDGSKRRGKRGPVPTKANLIRDLVLKMADENPDWGYGRIHGELKELGHKVSWQTVRRVMQEHGLLDDPNKPKRTPWKTFLQSHFECIAAADFFSVEAWTLRGLRRYLVFFVIDIASRRVEIASIHADPCETQMIQIARNLTDPEHGFLKGKRILIHDRDVLYTKKFVQTLRAGGVRSLKIPKRSPNLNAYAEAFVGSIKRECLDKLILFGESGVRHAIEQYIEHYHLERVHKNLGRRIVQSQAPPFSTVPNAAPDTPPPTVNEIRCRERLGGLLKSYHRKAA